jgi:hypothetical protein
MEGFFSAIFNAKQNKLNQNLRARQLNGFSSDYRLLAAKV